MHGRKRESTASRLERRAKSLPKVKLLQKLHKEIVHLQNADDNEKGKDGGGGGDDDDDDHDTKTQKMESLMLTLTQKLVEIQPEMITCWNKRKARFCLYVVVRQQKKRGRGGGKTKKCRERRITRVGTRVEEEPKKLLRLGTQEVGNCSVVRSNP